MRVSGGVARGNGEGFVDCSWTEAVPHRRFDERGGSSFRETGSAALQLLHAVVEGMLGQAQSDDGGECLV